MLTLEDNQQFNWKICGEDVPLGNAKFTVRQRNSQGKIISDLGDEAISIDDSLGGLFSLNSDTLSPEAATLQIYGHLPNLNPIIIAKGALPRRPGDT